ncbi:MAG: tol-pal system-associated acyl-CoA thioesterase [Proteobacteria bacterium]|nr:tol-pal system-associated acyl-CoA thioesterase [Pseudomonadota bacterium]
MTHHTLSLRIYYEDTDFSGFVYHARYLHFFERARTEMLRALGHDQRAMFANPEGPEAFVVRRMNIDFIRPALMDDIVEVRSVTTKVAGATMQIDQRLYRGETLLCSADVQVAYLVGGRPRRMPDTLRNLFEKAAGLPES